MSDLLRTLTSVPKSGRCLVRYLLSVSAQNIHIGASFYEPLVGRAPVCPGAVCLEDPAVLHGFIRRRHEWGGDRHHAPACAGAPFHGGTGQSSAGCCRADPSARVMCTPDLHTVRCADFRQKSIMVSCCGPPGTTSWRSARRRRQLRPAEQTHCQRKRRSLVMWPAGLPGFVKLVSFSFSSVYRLHISVKINNDLDLIKKKKWK